MIDPMKVAFIFVNDDKTYTIGIETTVMVAGKEVQKIKYEVWPNAEGSKMAEVVKKQRGPLDQFLNEQERRKPLVLNSEVTRR